MPLSLSQFPELQYQPLSGLSFKWAAKEAPNQPSFSAEFGPEGVGLGLLMLIEWDDLNTAAMEILGYSYRDASGESTASGNIQHVSFGPPMEVVTTTPHGLTDGDEVTIEDVAGCTAANGRWVITVLTSTTFQINGTCNGAAVDNTGTWTAVTDTEERASILRREIPWQNPLWRQLFARKITQVHAIKQMGKEYELFNLDGSAITSFGPGGNPNYGPYTTYSHALLTIAFWRPPYYVRTDRDILDEDGNPQEWLRYTSKTWQSDLQMLSRESGAFTWSSGQSWAGIGPSAGGAPVPGSVGQVVSHEKISRRWFQIPETGIYEILEQYGIPEGLPRNLIYTQTPTENPITSFQYPAGNPIKGSVNSPIGGGTDDFDFLTDEDLRFFGCYMGTLRLDGVELISQPLHLPPVLMNIPVFAQNEAISQQQYDIVFHFDLFDPPRNPAIWNKSGYRGHNLLPWSGDGLWYMAQSPLRVAGLGQAVTMFSYSDFTDLFRIL